MKKKITMARAVIGGKTYYIIPCTVLENEYASTKKRIEDYEDSKLGTYLGADIINPTDEFKADLEKMFVKLVRGDNDCYFTGDNDKYYITSYCKIKDLYDMLEAKAGI